MVKETNEKKTDSKEKMDAKEFESRMDQAGRRITDTVADGVRKIEEAFEKGKENLREDTRGSEGIQSLKGSPRMGLLLVGLGFLWLLNTRGLFDHWIFPVIMMGAGVYFILRSRA